MPSSSLGPVPPAAWVIGAATSLAVLLLAGGVWTQLDLDSDGLDAWTELDAGTDPLRADTDRDTLSDGFELDRALDPFERDTDDDTLTDPAELDDGTDPRSADSDDDGIRDDREPPIGTHPRVSDTDGDAIPDGIEVRVGTDPLTADTDHDGVADSTELTGGSDPHDPDSDDDGLPDPEELAAGPRDCDRDGYHEMVDSDDDADARPDGEEPPEHRCTPDVDGDGIPDGEEANPVCVERVDCDLDGLDDAVEAGTAFDRLDPDTFDVGLLDSVSWAFQQRGQPPSTDGDGDGIPDRWEQTTGLIDWGPYDPAPGRDDMLVEFVRVEGPDSSRLGPDSFTPVYQAVTRFFQDEGGIGFQWIESLVQLDEGVRPPLIPSSDTAYYEEVLAEAEHAANPYVTTVVMNPQHDASEIAHLGVAPIRGMLGAIDYGGHSNVHFRVQDQTFQLSPFLESVIVADRQDILQAWGYNDGGRQADGDLYVTTDDWRLTWRPFWFARDPTFHLDDGSTVPATRLDVTYDADELADTIAHELGHTLGLCHLTLADCRQNLSTADAQTVGVSTMDPRRQGATLEFLDSEWTNARTYLACPPQRPIALLAEGADREAIIEAKYAVTLENVLDVRVRDCQDHEALDRTLLPVANEQRYTASASLAADDLQPEAVVYTAPSEDTPPPPADRAIQATGIYAASASVIALAAGGVGVRLARPRVG